MTKTRITICFFILMLILPACGCTALDSKDINKKSILTAVAVDKKGDEFYFYVEIANIEAGTNSESKGGTGKKYTLVIGHGKTIPEARENLDRQIDKQIYLSAVRVLVLTENFAKDNLVEYLYRLRADELYRKKTFTVITREDPEVLFKTCNDRDLSVGFYTEDLLKTLEENGESFTRTTTRLLENLSNHYTGILLPCIGLQEQNISLVGYSVVNGSTIVGFIPAQTSKGMIFIKADKPQFNYVMPYKNNQFTIQVKLKKRKVKPTYKNDEIHFEMSFEFDATLMYGDKRTPYHFTETDQANVTRSLEEMLKTELTEAVLLAQDYYKSDYLQFDDEFRIKYPSQFDKMDWQTEFEKATFSIDVKVVLSNTWMMDYETGEQK